MKLFSVSSVSSGSRTAKLPILWGKVELKRLLMSWLRPQAKRQAAKPKANFDRSRRVLDRLGRRLLPVVLRQEVQAIFSRVLSFEDLERIYAPLHEADISKFADIVDAKVREYFFDTNLKRIRTLYGCTQAELAKRSNVSLRSIQMYDSARTSTRPARKLFSSTRKSSAARWRIFWRSIEPAAEDDFPLKMTPQVREYDSY